MIEAIIKIVLTQIAAAVAGLLKKKLENRESLVKNDQFKNLEKVLGLGIDTVDRFVVEYKFHRFLKYRIDHIEICAILKSNSPLHLFRIYSRAKKYIEFDEGFRIGNAEDFIKEFNKS
jgi:hypothetical protein